MEPPPDDQGLVSRSRAAAPSAAHGLLFAAKHVPRRTWWIGGIVVALVVGTIVAVATLANIDWAGLMDTIESLPPVPLILAIAVLPIFAFPILPAYLVAGARFGPWGGGLVITLATAVHLIAARLIGRSFLRDRLQRFLAKWHSHLPAIPDDEQAGVAVVAALIPGIPYFARNLLFPLMGVRLRVYLWIAVPIYVARSYVSILLGDLGTAPSRERLFILGGVEVLKAAICALVLWRLRVHHRRVHADASIV